MVIDAPRTDDLVNMTESEVAAARFEGFPDRAAPSEDVSLAAVVKMREWAYVAADVAGRLDRAVYGERSTSIAQEAGKYELNPQYLRRALACWRFYQTRKIASPDMRTLPIATVEAFKRWTDYDFESASKAAKDLMDGVASYNDVVEAERVARDAARGIPEGSASIKNFRDHVAEKAVDEYPFHRLSRSSKAPIKPSFELKSVSRGNKNDIAIVTIGPFHIDKANRQIVERARDCLAFSAMYNTVIAACASIEVKKQLDAILKSAKPRETNIVVWKFNASDYAKSQSDSRRS